MSYLSRTNAVLSCCSARLSHVIPFSKRHLCLFRHSVSYPFQLAGIRLALHPIPPAGEGCFALIPDYSVRKCGVTITQNSMRKVKLLHYCTVFLHMPYYISVISNTYRHMEILALPSLYFLFL